MCGVGVGVRVWCGVVCSTIKQSSFHSQVSAVIGCMKEYRGGTQSGKAVSVVMN